WMRRILWCGGPPSFDGAPIATYVFNVLFPHHMNSLVSFAPEGLFMSSLGLASPQSSAITIVPAVTNRPEPPPALALPRPEEIQAEIEHVLNKQLNPDLIRWVDGYAQVGKRNLYLWKWVRQGVEVTTLSCVEKELFDFACDTKVLGVVLDVLLDDIADRKGDSGLLEQLLAVPFDDTRLKLSQVRPEDRAYAEFTIDLWQEIKRRTKLLPLFSKFSRIWR